jgi:ectoine hydroxylase-related dioxygenase (phytanoyl-CoA dioxygenase family)
VLQPHGNDDASSRSAATFDETHHQLVPLRRGDAVAFHPLLAHGSGPNRSDGARRMVTVWCVGGSRFG